MIETSRFGGENANQYNAVWIALQQITKESAWYDDQYDEKHSVDDFVENTSGYRLTACLVQKLLENGFSISKDNHV